MKCLIKKNIMALMGILFANIYPVTVVYNLRIAETTRRKLSDGQVSEKRFKQRPSFGALVLFDNWRTFYNEVKQNSYGGLGTLIYAPKSFFLRADWAIGHVRNVFNEAKFSRTQTDDILFSGGYTAHLNDRTNVTLSGILGIPTHKDTFLEGVQFGTGHVGVGFQADGAHVYSTNKKNTLLGALRYIRFIPNNASLIFNSQKLDFRVDIGTLIDLFFAHNTRFERSVLEFGYNPSWAFGAKINPDLFDIASEIHFIRSNFFINYRYGFLIKKHLNAVSLGFSYGFDHSPKTVGIKRTITLWGSWGVNF